MTLSKGDDYPIHQTPEPVAYAGTDRNFYDRYFFNGYSTQPGNTAFFAAAFGVYPHLNIADAAFVVVRDGVETALHASRCLDMERMDISVGPIRIEVIEPLHKLRVTRRCAGSRHRRRHHLHRAQCADRGAALHPPDRPAHTDGLYAADPERTLPGWIELDGEARDRATASSARATGRGASGRSALRDPQPLAPAVAPQFFWLWAPTNFESASLFFHTNDDAAGLPWNRRAVWAAGRPAAARIRTRAGARGLEVRHAACRIRHRHPRRGFANAGGDVHADPTISSCWASATGIRNGATA